MLGHDVHSFSANRPPHRMRALGESTLAPLCPYHRCNLLPPPCGEITSLKGPQSVAPASRLGNQSRSLSEGPVVQLGSAEQQRLGEFLAAAVAADVHILGLETGGVLRSRFIGRGAVVGTVEILGRRLGGGVRVAYRRVG